MSNPSGNLGQGLSALNSSGLQRNPTATAEVGPPRSLPLTSIQAGPSQPRRTMEQVPLEELAAVDRRERGDPTDPRAAPE
jgi:hypothetical protein